MTATTVTFTSTIEAKPNLQYNTAFGNPLKVATNTIEVATTSIDETDDRVMFLALPSSSRLVKLDIFNDDLDSHATPTLVVDIGLFYGGGQIVSGVRKSAGDAIDDDALATALTTLQAANTVGVNVLTEAQDIANLGKTLWQLGGLTTDPGGLIYIGTSVGANAAATAAAGTVTMVAYYV